MKNNLAVLLGCLLALSACKRDILPSATPAPTPTNFKDLKAPENFSWKTYSEVTLDVTGIKTIVPVKGRLQVTSTDGKIVYFSTAYQMDKTEQFGFILPNHVRDVNVTFGKITKKVAVFNKKIAFDCKSTLPVVK